MEKKSKVGVVRGASMETIKNKEFNIYVGISLGNKWFTKDNIKEHILWSLKYTKERVGLFVADALHAINYEVRNGEKPDKAKRRALKKGDEMIVMLREIIKELPIKDQKKVDLIRWGQSEATSKNSRSKHGV